MPDSHLTRFRELLGRYLVSGILVFAPLGITLWAMGWIIERLDELLLPRVLSLFYAKGEVEIQTPFVGALFTLLVVILVGVVARHLVRPELVRAWERLLHRVPLAGSIHSGIKQLFEAVFNGTDTSRFSRVVLIEYPRRGLYAVAFATGTPRGAVAEVMDRDLLNCFVPTTPNPTSGVFVIVPAEDAVTLDMSIEDGFKLVMSAGLVSPGDLQEAAAPVELPPATAAREAL